MSTKPTTPAECVIEAFGGIRPTARKLGLDPAAVYRWAQPKSNRGSDGVIPSRHHLPILDAARKARVKLTAHDLVFGR